MPINIYHTSFNTPLQEDVFSSLLSQMPDYICRKVLAYRRWQDKHASLLGRHLLIKAMSDEGYKADLHKIKYTAEGRPYLPGLPDFNISHAGNRVVCVLSRDGRVGIDMEEIKLIDPKDFILCFSPGEWHNIIDGETSLLTFYKYWTIKEAILKADGRGICGSLPSLDVTQHPIVMLDQQHWHVAEIAEFANYICHVASVVKVNNYQIQQVNYY
jgi:4'-phosphopantetheinyl transferase